MEIDHALAILKTLSDGLDPNTMQPLAFDSVYQRPSVIRALCTVIDNVRRAERKKERHLRLPSNAGKPWTRSEDEQLSRGFDGGQNVFSLAMQHNRTVGSIAARLVRLNKLSADELPRLVGPEKASRITDYENARRAALSEHDDVENTKAV